MRCPKCGYISFDHLATCLNCSKDFSDVESSAHGTTYSVTPPSFLKFSPSSTPREEDIQLVSVDDELEDELDVVDPDLNILIKEEDEGIAFHPDDDSLKDEFGDSGDFAASFDDELDAGSGDGHMEIDLSQFEDSIPQGEEATAGEEKFSIEMPEELNDISDLAPPVSRQSQTSDTPERKNDEEELNFDVADLDLKLDGLDMDFSLTTPDKGGKEDVINSLSLDDIDASGTIATTRPAPSPTPKAASAVERGEMDMDADLDFELDLGGLTIPKK